MQGTANKIASMFEGKEIEAFTHDANRSPNMLYINLDERCNEECVFCVVKGKNRGKFGSMSGEEAKKTIKKFVGTGGDCIVFTGGEPSLRDDLPDIIRFAAGLNGLKSVSIISNGVRLADRDYFERLISSDERKRVSFCISLHSHREEISELLTGSKGTFKKTVAAIGNIIGSGRSVSVYQVITSRNYRDLLPFCRFLNSNYPQIKDITFAYPFPQGNAELNDWINVRLSELRPRMLKALMFLEKRGYDTKIATCGQFPLCTIPGFEEKVLEPLIDCEKNIAGTVGERTFHEFEMASKEWVDHYKEKTSECKECIINGYCQGFWVKYTELFGFDGLEAVSENNFTGNKVACELKNDSDVFGVIRKLNPKKLNLVKVGECDERALRKLLELLRRDRIFAVLLAKGRIVCA